MGPTPSGYVVGVVHHRAYADLAACLASLAGQSVSPRAIAVLDADGDPDEVRSLRRAHPDVDWIATGNLGYAGGCNRLLAHWADRAPGAEYALLMNPDVVLDRAFAAAMSDALRERPRVALAGGRLARPEPGVLDSAGIEMPRHRRPRDRGAGEVDRGQYDRIESVFGATGAALWIRRAALDELAIDGEIFDEDFFLYHEDTDLSWRARRLGWEVLYVPDARGVHRRSWRADRRFQMPVAVRRHSFKNHYLEMIKNERARDFWRDLPWILAWETLRLGHALLRDPAILPAYWHAARLAPRAWGKRRSLRERIRRGRASATGCVGPMSPASRRASG